jgi:hypothetical protein
MDEETLIECYEEAEAEVRDARSLLDYRRRMTPTTESMGLCREADWWLQGACRRRDLWLRKYRASE